MKITPTAFFFAAFAPVAFFLSPLLSAQDEAAQEAADIMGEGLVPGPSAEIISSEFAEGVPGGVIVQSIEFSAVVVAVDGETREVTLRGPGGNDVEIVVGAAAQNFEQVEKGDIVDLMVVRELKVHMAEEGEMSEDMAAAVVARAPRGERPQGILGITGTLVGTVAEIDLAGHAVTLSFEDGTSETVKVRPDVDLTLRNVGEKVVFRVTDMIAISVSSR